MLQSIILLLLNDYIEDTQAFSNSNNSELASSFILCVLLQKYLIYNTKEGGNTLFRATQ